MFLYLHIMQAL